MINVDPLGVLRLLDLVDEAVEGAGSQGGQQRLVDAVVGRQIWGKAGGREDGLQAAGGAQ